MTPWHHLGKCSSTLDDLGMPLQLLVLQALQLTPSATVMSTQEAMGYDGLWLLDKKATVFKGNGIAHRIAVEWSTWSGCITWRMLQNKMMQNLRTCFNWFILIKQQRKPGRTCDFCDPLLSFFTGAGEVSATSSSSCGSSSSVASEWVGMHAFHRNQTALKISKNALKQESQRNQHEPTLT